MRPIHPSRPAVLLLAALAAAPLPAQVGTVRTNARVQSPGSGNTIVVWPRTLQSLQARLDSFAAALPAEEAVLWDRALLRAATAPSAAGEVRVTPVLQIGPGGGCDDAQGPDDAPSRIALIVQGGRAGGPSNRIIVQGGLPAGQSGIVVQGGRTAAGTPAANAPRPNPAGNGAVAIGPKQDDPAPPPQSLGRRLAAFGQTLSAEERGALDWLLTRVSAGRPGTPGGLPPGPCRCVSLRQALGIDVLAIGPKQDDPAPPPPAAQWTLRY
jgi:hypothetical protein